jgi:hypothetical protein
MVGQNEESVAMVSRSNIGRSESTPLRIEPERGKVREDDFKAVRAEGRDVFNDDQSRLNFGDDAGKLLPEPASLAFDSGLLSGDADVLTREAARDAAHQAPKWVPIEGGHIRPNRRWSHVAFFHARSQDFTGVGFPLHVSDDSAADACEFNSHVESSGSAE